MARKPKSSAKNNYVAQHEKISDGLSREVEHIRVGYLRRRKNIRDNRSINRHGNTIRNLTRILKVA